MALRHVNVGLVPFVLLLHEVWGIFIHLQVNESNKAWFPTSHHRFYFFLKDLFSQTLHKSLKNFATSTTVFTINYQYFSFARIFGLLLETQMQRFAHWKELCMGLQRRVRVMAVLLCSLSVVGCLFWLFLVLLRINEYKVFPVPFYLVILFAGGWLAELHGVGDLPSNIARGICTI